MSKIDLYVAKRMREQGKSPEEISQHFGCSLAAVYKAIKKFPRLCLPLSVEALTVKQRKFVELKSSGLSGTEAALRAFDCGSRKSAKEIACQYAKKPEIQAAMSDWLEWHGCGRDRRAERLAEFVENPDPNVALPALREAMKAGADFPNPKVQVETEEVQYVISFTHDPADGKIVDLNSPTQVKRIGSS
jgi:hypothetical protein